MRMIEKLRQENPELIVIMHSDGAVAPLIDDFIEIGVDVYNPVQPNVPVPILRNLRINMETEYRSSEELTSSIFCLREI